MGVRDEELLHQVVPDLFFRHENIHFGRAGSLGVWCAAEKIRTEHVEAPVQVYFDDPCACWASPEDIRLRRTVTINGGTGGNTLGLSFDDVGIPRIRHALKWLRALLSREKSTLKRTYR